MPKNDHTKRLLCRAAVVVWNDFAVGMINSLVESMARRIEAVIEAGGWYTKYWYIPLESPASEHSRYLNTIRIGAVVIEMCIIEGVVVDWGGGLISGWGVFFVHPL
jgi:hypothetical protein